MTNHRVRCQKSKKYNNDEINVATYKYNNFSSLMYSSELGAMSISRRSPVPDFSVKLHSASTNIVANIYCENSTPDKPDASNAKLRQAAAHLQTETTYIEVSDVTWDEPTTINVVPHRPGFCSMISASASTAVEYGYDDELDRPGKLGHILFLLPGHEISALVASGSFRAVTCSFETDYAESVIGPLANLSHAQLMGALDVRSSLISTILLRLMHEALYPGPLSSAIVESFGRAMLVESARCLLTGSDTKERGKLTARHLAIVEEHLTSLSGKPPSVFEIAQACGFSERYFAKLFRHQTNCSVAQYIKAAQIAKAKALLWETDLPLKEIAYRLGFSSPANFSSAFRAATGITPGKMRKDE